MAKQNLSFDDAITGIHEDIRVSLKATSKLLNPNNLKFSFQIFGYDFMIDENLNPWIIEINMSPSMDHSTPVTKKLVKMVQRDMANLITSTPKKK